MITATIFQAKTNLSGLVKKAQQGEEVIITSGREKKPIARIEAIRQTLPRRLGAWENPKFELSDAFWEPMSDEECGLTDDGIL